MTKKSRQLTQYQGKSRSQPQVQISFWKAQRTKCITDNPNFLSMDIVVEHKNGTYAICLCRRVAGVSNVEIYRCDRVDDPSESKGQRNDCTALARIRLHQRKWSVSMAHRQGYCQSPLVEFGWGRESGIRAYICCTAARGIPSKEVPLFEVNYSKEASRLVIDFFMTHVSILATFVESPRLEPLMKISSSGMTQEATPGVAI